MWQGLRERGWAEGQNFILERRYSEGRNDRLPALAAELVRLQPDLIVIVGTPAALAAKEATTTIPVVFVTVGDPVGSGLVSSLAKPGGNMTGTGNAGPQLLGSIWSFSKRLSPRSPASASLSTRPSHSTSRAAPWSRQQLGASA